MASERKELKTNTLVNYNIGLEADTILVSPLSHNTICLLDKQLFWD